MVRRGGAATAGLVVLILALGLTGTWLTRQLTVKRLAGEALAQARIVAATVDPMIVRNLPGNAADTESPAYRELKQQLVKVRHAHGRCRFLYLMGRRADGTVFFYMDSQPPDSPDYAPPGLVYDEVSPEYLHTFDTGEPRTVGPITDRWGTLVTSLVPIYADNDTTPVAVLGMDTDVRDWNREILARCLLPGGLTALIMMLVFFLLALHRNRQAIKAAYEAKTRTADELAKTLQHVKVLQGILPVCAKCKRIRDDQGYWNQIENYIRDHSEAQFTHGICPDCAKDLYPAYVDEPTSERALADTR